jgi:hypothetical protein
LFRAKEPVEYGLILTENNVLTILINLLLVNIFCISPSHEGKNLHGHMVQANVRCSLGPPSKTVSFFLITDPSNCFFSHSGTPSTIGCPHIRGSGDRQTTPYTALCSFFEQLILLVFFYQIVIGERISTTALISTGGNGHSFV